MLQALSWAALGTGFTFLMTTLGAAVVFFFVEEPRPQFQRTMLGFAAGVMTAASVWSLLLPAIERAERGPLPGWLPPAAGLVIGAVGLLRLEQAAGRLLCSGDGHCGRMVLAVTLHNLPEGMVVGLAAALALSGAPQAVRWRWPSASGCKTSRRARRSASRFCRKERARNVRFLPGRPPASWSRWGRCWPLRWRAG